MVLPVINIGSKLDGKGFKQAETASDKLGKKVKTLAKTFAVTFSAAAMLSYGKNAVKAFAENEKSAKRLETVLKNLGLAFDTDVIEKNLGDISAKFGYEGEVLREAFQKLITATGSTTKSQDLLNLSLDVAAGSGQDLLTVNQDLAALYVGNTKGLRKYNLGLSQTELKTLDFNEAVKLLTQTFAGAGAAELETYSGKMRVLKEAAGNAQEIIGAGLIDAISKLGDDKSVENLAKNMETAAKNTADVIRGIGVLAAKLKSIPGFDGKDWEYVYNISWFKFLADLGKKSTAPGMRGDQEYGGVYADRFNAQKETANAKARAKAEADAAKRQKELLALQKKSAIAEKNKLALSKAAAVFDTTRVSLTAALKATYDKETRLRLEALMAIEEDNGDLALKKISELAALQKNADLAKLAGIKEISDSTLLAINTQLLNELGAINKSKMAEGDKELAREEAFKKYNAAITEAGQLAAKEQYSERVQIQLTEIARLASQSNTTSALKTQVLLREQAELSMIDRVAKAQAAADAARLKSLQEYLNLLGKAGGGSAGGTSGGSGIPPGDFIAPISKELGASASIDALLEYADAASARANAFADLLDLQSAADEAALMSGPLGQYATTINVKIEAGLGDPEAIARAVEDVLNQSTYRGTSVNRGSGDYTIA
jgi:hypothetical protein